MKSRDYTHNQVQKNQKEKKKDYILRILEATIVEVFKTKPQNKKLKRNKKQK